MAQAASAVARARDALTFAKDKAELCPCLSLCSFLHPCHAEGDSQSPMLGDHGATCCSAASLLSEDEKTREGSGRGRAALLQPLCLVTLKAVHVLALRSCLTWQWLSWNFSHI